MRLLPSIALAAVLAIPAATLAQQPERIRPGAQLDTTFIRPGSDSLAMLLEHEGDTVRMGTVVLETRIDAPSGVRRVVYVQRLRFDGEDTSGVADSVNAHWGTLFPISVHNRGDEPTDYLFGPRGVRIVSLDDSTTREVALDAPVFYQGVDLLLRALPLRTEYRAVVSVLASDGSTEDLHITVTGEERVRTLDGGSCAVWVVDVPREFDPSTLRLSTADRSLVRLDAGQSMVVRTTGCP